MLKDSLYRISNVDHDYQAGQYGNQVVIAEYLNGRGFDWDIASTKDGKYTLLGNNSGTGERQWGIAPALEHKVRLQGYTEKVGTYEWYINAVEGKDNVYTITSKPNDGYAWTCDRTPGYDSAADVHLDTLGKSGQEWTFYEYRYEF
ncbi:hypothetical protein Moror_5844 [Moniliophthora roreri MCA 2997]|uniref:Ricin B lectin domain-containing protein n=1 Tax=Moniliophthora roreri (strain MCA 2997) TaxID=1381753 RepID=V2WK60_MONRO|nr:hypothetical protein Moror_5844 [Moniliophthora roreri MCA 2997]